MKRKPRKVWRARYTWYRPPSLSAPSLGQRDPQEQRQRYAAFIEGRSADFVPAVARLDIAA